MLYNSKQCTTSSKTYSFFFLLVFFLRLFKGLRNVGDLRLLYKTNMFYPDLRELSLLLCKPGETRTLRAPFSMNYVLSYINV